MIPCCEYTEITKKLWKLRPSIIRLFTLQTSFMDHEVWILKNVVMIARACDVVVPIVSTVCATARLSTLSRTCILFHIFNCHRTVLLLPIIIHQFLLNDILVKPLATKNHTFHYLHTDKGDQSGLTSIRFLQFNIYWNYCHRCSKVLQH